jgi:hypothetical protein
MQTIAHSPSTVHTSSGIPAQTWIAAVHAEVVRLKTEKRTLGRRLDDAEDLALGGAVLLDPQGLWQVESRTSPGIYWQVDGSCDCPDAEKQAPEGLCAHRLAVGIVKRALRAVQCSTDAQPTETRVSDQASAVLPHTAPGATAMLPEAAFSLCLKGKLGGQDAQLTVRGATYAEFAANVAAVRSLLDAPGGAPATKDSAPPAPHATPQPETPPACPYHGPAKASAKAPGTWYCTRKLHDGSYCTFRWPEKA